jgi:PAS domain-containing protein
MLVEALPDAILVHSENGIVFVNPFCVRLHAAQGPEELIGRDISEFIKPEFVPSIMRRVEECYLTGAVSHGLYSQISVSRKQVYHEVTHREDQSGFEGNIAETLELDLAALRASQLAEQSIGTHLGPALAAIQDPTSRCTRSAPRWTARDGAANTGLSEDQPSTPVNACAVAFTATELYATHF